jgi:hypothetical protein
VIFLDPSSLERDFENPTNQSRQKKKKEEKKGGPKIGREKGKMKEVR